MVFSFCVISETPITTAVTLEDTDEFIIMDNAPVHGGAEMNNPRHVSKKLPAYSPMLNPIENAFSALKFQVKARLDVQAVRDQVFNAQAAADQGLTLLQYRLGILEGVIRPLSKTWTPSVRRRPPTGPTVCSPTCLVVWTKRASLCSYFWIRLVDYEFDFSYWLSILLECVMLCKCTLHLFNFNLE